MFGAKERIELARDARRAGSQVPCPVVSSLPNRAVVACLAAKGE